MQVTVLGVRVILWAWPALSASSTPSRAALRNERLDEQEIVPDLDQALCADGLLPVGYVDINRVTHSALLNTSRVAERRPFLPTPRPTQPAFSDQSASTQACRASPRVPETPAGVWMRPGWAQPPLEVSQWLPAPAPLDPETVHSFIIGSLWLGR